MYQKGLDLESLKVTILNNLYMLIGNSVNKGLYAFKGGYILSRKLPNIRRTSDIDITILNQDTFELITMDLRGYLDSLVQQGYIWNYTIKMPVVTETKNMSGGIKVYVKRDANTPKWVLCGIDMSIHSLGDGVELSVEGFPQYSHEYMLADKVSALYKSEKNVVRRIRDILDIYLILGISNTLDKQKILRRVSYLNVNIKNLSTFEKLVKSNPTVIADSLNSIQTKGERIQQGFYTEPKVIVGNVLKFLTWLRG